MTVVERLEKIGIRRRGTPQRGFRYARADGRSALSSDVARILELKSSRPGAVAGAPLTKSSTHVVASC